MISWPSLAVHRWISAAEPVLACSNKNRVLNSIRIDNPENSATDGPKFLRGPE
jgi:hypothetical protein